MVSNRETAVVARLRLRRRPWPAAAKAKQIHILPLVLVAFLLLHGGFDAGGVDAFGIIRPSSSGNVHSSLGSSSSTTALASTEVSSSSSGTNSTDNGSNSDSSNTKSIQLPDYGKTSIEVDKIRLTRAKTWKRKDLFGNTLIDSTMEEMKNDPEFQRAQQRLEQVGIKKINMEERKQRRRALDSLGIESFDSFLKEKILEHSNDNGVEEIGFPLVRQTSKVLQINIGLYCNQACVHCHVESSPLRTEMMAVEGAARIVELLKRSPSVTTLDITGGAPELNDHFRLLVRMARAVRPDLEIIDRCNLTVLQEPGQEDLVDFLKECNVRIVASLPCYSAENVNKQRGNQVFERSISALLALNEAGYGHPPSSSDNDATPPLIMDLVYNPLGAFLPPEQTKLEAKYKEELDSNFGILFNSLFTMTNIPVKRFADFLHRRGELQEYMDLLQRNFNYDTISTLMCLETISVGYDGKLYDCDFNQQLGIPINGGLTIFDIDSLDDLQQYKVQNDNHCFGCTAGMGSS